MSGVTGHARALSAAAAVALMAWTGAAAGAAGAAPAAAPAVAPLKIGIIGAGHIGGTLASLWVKAGHEVLVSSRHPGQLEGLVRSLGPRGPGGYAARGGAVRQCRADLGALRGAAADRA